MALPHFGGKNINIDQLQYKELFDMASEIANYCRNKKIEGISTKKKLTNTGGKYKWSDGKEIKFICNDGIEFNCGITSYYEDTNTYNKADLLTETIYYFKMVSKDTDMDTFIEKFAYLKGKLRKMRIHKLLNTK